jgi:hypothetical protein
MRRVRKTLFEAGILPPDPVQKVMLMRESGTRDTHAPETGLARDTSVDHALDAQVGKARAIEDGEDLLDTPPPSP